MSHPKNSIPLPATQQALLTKATSFSCREGEALHPFAVQEGIDVEEALNFACGLMASVDSLITTCISSGVLAPDLNGIRFLAQAGQALVSASVHAIEQGGGK